MGREGKLELEKLFGRIVTIDAFDSDGEINIPGVCGGLVRPGSAKSLWTTRPGFLEPIQRRILTVQRSRYEAGMVLQGFALGDFAGRQSAKTGRGSPNVYRA